MDIKEHRKLIENRSGYDNLLKSGMFWELFPGLTGNFHEDRIKILRQEKLVGQAGIEPATPQVRTGSSAC